MFPSKRISSSLKEFLLKKAQVQPTREDMKAWLSNNNQFQQMVQNLDPTQSQNFIDQNHNSMSDLYNEFVSQQTQAYKDQVVVPYNEFLEAMKEARVAFKRKAQVAQQRWFPVEYGYITDQDSNFTLNEELLVQANNPTEAVQKVAGKYLEPGFDIRGEQGFPYALSRHPEQGNVYEIVQAAEEFLDGFASLEEARQVYDRPRVTVIAQTAPPAGVGTVSVPDPGNPGESVEMSTHPSTPPTKKKKKKKKEAQTSVDFGLFIVFSDAEETDWFWQGPDEAMGGPFDSADEAKEDAMKMLKIGQVGVGTQDFSPEQISSIATELKDAFQVSLQSANSYDPNNLQGYLSNMETNMNNINNLAANLSNVVESLPENSYAKKHFQSTGIGLNQVFQGVTEIQSALDNARSTNTLAPQDIDNIVNFLKSGFEYFNNMKGLGKDLNVHNPGRQNPYLSWSTASRVFI